MHGPGTHHAHHIFSECIQRHWRVKGIALVQFSADLLAADLW